MATWSDGDTLIQLEEDEEYDFELAQRRMEAERAAREEEAFQRNTLNLDIPPLPNGKTHHLFISHCNDPPEEAEWAEQLVNTMERDFGLKCLWPKRDFTPGHDVGALIQSGIVSSVKVVFILSPASMESRWCEYERNFAFGISVENKENQIIPVMLSQCDFPGILKTLNYIDVPAGEDYAFKIRRCFDEDTRDFDHLVPELMKYCKNEKGPTNGTVARILGEKNLKYTCRGSAWSFRDLDQHQRYELRQLGSKFVERVYYEAKDIANTSAYMKYYSTIHSFRHCCGICCCGTTFCMLLILLIYFIVEVSDRKIVNGNFLLAVVLLIPFLGAGLVYVAHVQMLKRLKARLQAYTLGHVLKTNILVNYGFCRLCGPPTLKVMYYDLKPCMKYICDIIYGAREAGETFPERDRDREDKTRKAGKHFILSLIRRNYDLLFDNGFETSVVNRHPTLHKNKCICELLEKQVRQMYCNQI
ncbi:uncharacterized protein LOC124135158 isoform X1 [Haliotis rufescens]|uniref:uncharacterized protein LOC124135158 isoform X1 n=1 Tax=Haliotis rufescens TaxID=6454 RepID=UPI001EB021E6|nr:uncharacterized protein LOC124135158 isoform X1 [Haliotis rufescens]XP_046356332.1 uncharacterized protein LOC124135158 isoform X1 [Haliotis rufescens]